MIYLDTSVLLAQVLAEDRKPPPALWRQDLVSSRLTSYEAWTRLHAKGLAATHGGAVNALLGRTALLEMTPLVLARALEAFPAPVRTLDAIHLASVEFLRERGQSIELATYDRRMAQAAHAMGIEVHALS